MKLKIPNAAIITNIYLLGLLLAACSSPILPSVTPSSPAKSSTTPVPTATMMPTPTNRPTPRPTLSPEEGRLYFIELLNTNAGCELPCFWGFAPGESKGADVASFLKIFGVPTMSREHRGFIGHSFFPFEHYKNRIQNHIVFYEDDGVIRDIAIETVRSDIATRDEFRELWGNYFPTQVIANYGLPSRVFFSAVQPHQPYESIYYALGLIYDHLGFMAVYRGKGAPEYGANYIFCPSYTGYGNLIDYFWIYIQSPDLLTPVEDLNPNSGGSLDSIRTLEEATGLSIEEFTNEYLDENNTPCFETPVDIWPS